MKQHLLRVTCSVLKFRPLIAAVRHGGARVGWLELSADDSRPEPIPESLAQAVEGEVLRAVAIGGNRSLAVKPLKGPPVMRDLLREHFRGCVLVLVHGAVEAPLLEPKDSGWILSSGDSPNRYWTTEELVVALRKPRPWK